MLGLAGDHAVALLPIYTYNHPVLRKKARLIKRPSDDLSGLAVNMLETMHRANGIGLAANQIGSLQRIIVVDISGTDGVDAFAPLVMVNPEVVDNEGQWAIEEGCLSIPELRHEVQRPEKVHLRFRDLSYDLREIEAYGLLGRVILHEIDHLNGVLFIDHINVIKRKLLKGRLNKIDRGEVEVGYDVVSNQPVVAT
jgi:peptide deformylase